MITRRQAIAASLAALPVFGVAAIAPEESYASIWMSPLHLGDRPKWLYLAYNAEMAQTYADEFFAPVSVELLRKIIPEDAHDPGYVDWQVASILQDLASPPISPRKFETIVFMV